MPIVDKGQLCEMGFLFPFTWVPGIELRSRLHSKCLCPALRHLSSSVSCDEEGQPTEERTKQLSPPESHPHSVCRRVVYSVSSPDIGPELLLPECWVDNTPVRGVFRLHTLQV